MNRFLPTTIKEVKDRGWDKLEVILISGDAYVDHPSFGVAMVGRYLESLGVKVGIIASPDIHTKKDFTKLGEPTWFFGVTAGNLDSMLIHKTASLKRRSDDHYVEGGLNTIRPKRATIVYCNKLREIFNKPQILIGGLESSLRRYAHYDYWDNTVRRSILLDARADLLVYGMAEPPLKEIIKNMRKGQKLKNLRNIRGTVSNIDEKEKLELGEKMIDLPSYEKTKNNKNQYAQASKIIHLNQNPHSAKCLVQKHGNRYICVYPPAHSLSESEMDLLYSLPFTRLPHPVYKEIIPAYEIIRFSITAMRGCFGGCSFCALTVHQGKSIQNRPISSIVQEVKKIEKMKGFKGYISDIGGPTANMYQLGCSSSKLEANCKKLSCVHPGICKYLRSDHSEQIKMLRKARSVKGIKKVFIASGIRFDLANRSVQYIKELAAYHVSGQLRVAPEHNHPSVLNLMRKPPISEFEKFKKIFMKESERVGLEQYIILYLIAAHPGCELKHQIDLAEYLKKNNIRPRQVQEFIPLPLTLAADIYYSGIDPMTGKKVRVVKNEKERNLQKDLMLYYKYENRTIIQQAKRKLGKGVV